MKKADLWGFSNKPSALKAAILLLFLYGTLNLISNLIYAFFVRSSGGSFFDVNLSFGSIADALLNMLVFFITCIPVILTFVVMIIIWRGKKLGYLTSIIILIPSFIIALGGLSYLVTNLPKLFTEDYLFLTKTTSGMTWMLGDNDYTTSLIVFRLIILKSFIKALVEIIFFGFLSLIAINGKSYFNKR